MARLLDLGLALSFVLLAPVHATTTNPIQITPSTTLPLLTPVGESYSITYTLLSNLPFRMPSGFINKLSSNDSNAFTVIDSCNGLILDPGEICTFIVNYNPLQTGNKSASMSIEYGKTTIPLVLNTQSIQSDFVGLIGMNYQPNHYPQAYSFNFHDVFYVGTSGAAGGFPTTPEPSPAMAVSNVYAELAQLKAAGFNTVRSYQTTAYSWIEIINQAHTLGMKVIYEANIPQNGSQSDITAATALLNTVIAQVGLTQFNQTVTLVFAGHENFSDAAHVPYLVSAVNALKAITSVPVSSALVSGDLIGPPPGIDSLTSSYSATAPLAFDPYPFQWGTTPPDEAVTNAQLDNSIAFDYEKVFAQSFYKANPKPILMAESGWATDGLGTYAGYACAPPINNPSICMPSVANAATYLSMLYTYVLNKKNLAGLLVFEAYDEPAKASGIPPVVYPDDAEHYYGVFDANCNLKGHNNLALLPPAGQSYDSAVNKGCQGFIEGALVPFSIFTGTQIAPFTVAITNNINPTTTIDSSMTVVVPVRDRQDIATPWPYFLIYNGAHIVITGSATGQVCTINAAVVSGSPPVLGTISAPPCNCNSTGCYLPNPF